jgi:outer membrane protein OmpA-like peptidoglycan-associated protein
MMNPSRFRPFAGLSISALLLAGACFAAAPTQETQSALETERKQLDLEKQQHELEKKQLELEKKQLELQRQQMENTARQELQLKETDKGITMQLEGDVLFDFDKAEIKPEATQTLDKVGTVIAQFPEGKVLIEGYTDSKGSPNRNLELSKRRAEAVKDWLVTKKGIAEAIITTRGLGETKPVAPNANPDGSDNPKGRQQNRRVEITVEKT